MKIKIYDHETEETIIMSLKEFEIAFNNDEINQSICIIEFIGVDNNV